ncbi:hypothetical protein [Neobacillus sp. PS2-9]|nr:hypothetical protein [Neobacillus sp. PS2-9]WML60281.1 hypothetical protein RCG25_11060 [Neobacillus sp. PS2-9]
MSTYSHKKEEESGFTNSSDQGSLENSTQSEKLPEFDVIGTALNDI